MFYLVRHGESIANAGQRTSSPAMPPLTDKGREQAKAFADSFNKIPDLIVHSSYVRTKQTAEPLINKFPATQVEVWEVQEFTFLDTQICANTTTEERREMVDEYFAKNDVDFVHGVGAESFNQLIGRVDAMLAKLRQIGTDKTVVIFTHELFIKATQMRLNNLPLNLTTLLNTEHIPNTGVVIVGAKLP